MHHSDCTPRIPTVTAEEAVKMSWLWSSSQTLKEVSQLFNAITCLLYTSDAADD